MGTLEYSCVTSNTGGFFCFNSTVSYTCLLLTQSIHFIETTQNNVMLCYIIYSNLWSGCGGVVKGAVLKAKEIGAAVYEWCKFESDRWKKKKLTAQRSNSSTVWFNYV